MAQPNPYVPATSFLSFESQQSWFPGHQLDAEFNNLDAVIGQIEANLKLIQRDDGALQNGSVTFQSLSPTLQTAGLSPLTAWAVGVTYAAPQAVINNSSLYQCVVGHISSSFATDLAAGKWVLLANLSFLGGTTAITANTVAAGPTSGASGPPTFRTLVGADIPAFAQPGHLRMWPNSTAGLGSSFSNYFATDGSGAAINLSGTTTGGLAEMDAVSAAVGWPTIIYDLGIRAAAPHNLQFIGASTTWQTLPRGLWSTEILNATIQSVVLNSNPGIRFESAQTGRFIAAGSQIVYSGTGSTVLVSPSVQTPQDALVCFALNEFAVTTLVGGPASKAELQFDLSNMTTAASAGVVQNRITVGEVNGNGSTYGILVTDPATNGAGGNSFFQHNIITAMQTHGQSTAGIQVGTTGANQSALGQNVWTAFFGNISAPDCMVSYESNSLFTVAADTTVGSTNMLRFPNGAHNNIVLTLGKGGSTNGVVDGNTVGTGGNIVIGNGAITIGQLPVVLASAGGMSQGLDALGSGVGAVLYRGSSTWAALGAGTSGSVLATQGSGGSPPQWLATTQILDEIGSGTNAILIRDGVSGWLARVFTGDVTFLAAGTSAVGAIAGTTVSGTTGSSKVVFSTSPTLVTPVLGVASATSLAVTGASAATNGIYLPAANTVGFAVNSLDALRLLPTASAVNYGTITQSATGARVAFGVGGSDTDVGVDFISKGAGGIQFSSNGNNGHGILKLSGNTVAAANGISIFNNPSGSAPSIGAADLGGTGDANIDLQLNPKGTGVLFMGNTGSFTANGAVATALTSIGPTGSHTTVQEWFTVKNSSGVVRYIPAF